MINQACVGGGGTWYHGEDDSDQHDHGVVLGLIRVIIRVAARVRVRVEVGCCRLGPDWGRLMYLLWALR